MMHFQSTYSFSSDIDHPLLRHDPNRKLSAGQKANVANFRQTLNFFFLRVCHVTVTRVSLPPPPHTKSLASHRHKLPIWVASPFIRLRLSLPRPHRRRRLWHLSRKMRVVTTRSCQLTGSHNDRAPHRSFRHQVRFPPCVRRKCVHSLLRRFRVPVAAPLRPVTARPFPTL